jgi:hypothetical protein
MTGAKIVRSQKGTAQDRSEITAAIIRDHGADPLALAEACSNVTAAFILLNAETSAEASQAIDEMASTMREAIALRYAKAV